MAAFLGDDDGRAVLVEIEAAHDRVFEPLGIDLQEVDAGEWIFVEHAGEGADRCRPFFDVVAVGAIQVR